MRVLSQTTQCGTTCGARTARKGESLSPSAGCSSQDCQLQSTRGRGLILRDPHKGCPLCTGTPDWQAPGCPARCARSPLPQPTGGRPALAFLARKARLGAGARRAAAARAGRERPHAKGRPRNLGAPRPHTSSSSQRVAGPLPTGHPKPTAACRGSRVTADRFLRPPRRLKSHAPLQPPKSGEAPPP